MISVSAVAEDATKPADAPRMSPPPVSSQTQLHAMFSRSRLDARLWLDCRLALTKSLLSTAGGLCSSDG